MKKESILCGIAGLFEDWRGLNKIVDIIGKYTCKLYATTDGIYVEVRLMTVTDCMPFYINSVKMIRFLFIFTHAQNDRPAVFQTNRILE